MKLFRSFTCLTRKSQRWGMQRSTFVPRQDPLLTANLLRKTVAAIDPNLPVFNLMTLTEQVNDTNFGDTCDGDFFPCAWAGWLHCWLPWDSTA